MSDRLSPRAYAPLILQLSIAALVVAGTILVPPARGAILLVPLSGDTGALIRSARESDARLLGPGPVAGSIVVVGERASLLGAAWRRGALALAAGSAGCGGRPIA